MTEGEHLDLDTLAGYAEGILGDERATAARTHLRECSQCRARTGDLTEVSRRLAEAPSPTMPDDVAARMDDALAEASSARAVVSLGRRRRRSRWLGSAAAGIITLVVAGGVFGGLTNSGLLGDGGSGSAGSGSAAHKANDTGAAELQRESLPTSRNGRSQTGPQPTDVAADSVTASGREYSARSLPEQASELLRAESGSGMRVQMAHPTPAALRSLAKPHALATCVSRLAGPDDKARLAIDLANYSGKPSAVIVSSDTRPPGGDVWVVDPSCTRVRVHTELPRHGE